MSARNVVLESFRIEGNRGGQHGNAPGFPFTGGIVISGCNGLRIRDVVVNNASTYSVQVGNCADVHISDCRLLPFPVGVPVVATNTDGIHVNGNTFDVQISDCLFHTGDDAIALNTNEGFGGSIERVAVANCAFDNCQIGMRMYAGNGTARDGIVSRVAVSNCCGTFNVTSFLFGSEYNHTSGRVDQVTNVSVSNWYARGGAFAMISDNCGLLTFDNCQWEAGAGSAFRSWFNRTQVQQLNLNNFTFVDTPSSQAQGVFSQINSAGATDWQSVHINGLRSASINDGANVPINYDATAKYICLFTAGNCSIQRLVLDGIDTRVINTMNYGGDITRFAPHSISGSSCSGMIPISDSVMADATLYRSSQTASGNSLSLMVGTTPVRLTP